MRLFIVDRSKNADLHRDKIHRRISALPLFVNKKRIFRSRIFNGYLFCAPDKSRDRPVVGFLYVIREKTGGELVCSSMVLDALAALSFPAARLI
jgi:hypothetical protein